MELSSAKRKTAEEIVRGSQLFAPLLGELANKKKPADGAAAAEEVERATAGEKPPSPGPKARMPEREVRQILSRKPPPPPGPKARMPEREVLQILSRKPVPAPPEFEALKRSNPDLTPLPGEEMDDEKEDLFFRAKVYYCMEERYPKLQEWVHEELWTKGFVEMDDDWVRRRAEAAEAFEEEQKEIEKKVKDLKELGLVFSDDEMDFLLDSDSDDDDEEEENSNDRGGNHDSKEGGEQ